MHALLDVLTRSALEAVYRVHRSELAKVPAEGPLIVYCNHTARLEVPVLQTQLAPRQVVGWVKSELWAQPLLRALLERWGAIPLDRGRADTAAFRTALAELRRGRIVAVAPEGRLNRTGVLRPARAGVVTLARRSGAPLLPLAHWGGEELSANLRRLRRTDFHIRVGESFTLDTGDGPLRRAARERALDELMSRLASLLPERYRGAYG